MMQPESNMLLTNSAITVTNFERMMPDPQ